MKESFYLAFQYLKYHRSRTIILLTCITLISFLPLALNVLLSKSEDLLRSRAAETSLILGSKGSSLDLVMNTLYFQSDLPEPITMSTVDDIFDSGYAGAIPMYVKFKARGYPIVGTSIDYLDYRKVQLKEGRKFSQLGECVAGSKLSDELGLQVGDHVVSSSEDVFNIAGVYPLKMMITGILEETGTSDDEVLITDVRTTWVIEGLIHGHEDLTKGGDPSLILAQNDSTVRANAKLYQYNEINDNNAASFHEHGDQGSYPLTSLIVTPFSDKDGTLLQGEMLLDENTSHQLVVPLKVISEMLDQIFKIKSILDGIILFMGAAAFLALILVFSLSAKLRQREIKTAFKLGGSKNFIVRLFTAEIAILLGLSFIANMGLLGLTNYLAANHEAFILFFI